MLWTPPVLELQLWGSRRPYRSGRRPTNCITNINISRRKLKNEPRNGRKGVEGARAFPIHQESHFRMIHMTGMIICQSIAMIALDLRFDDCNMFMTVFLLLYKLPLLFSPPSDPLLGYNPIRLPQLCPVLFSDTALTIMKIINHQLKEGAWLSARQYSSRVYEFSFRMTCFCYPVSLFISYYHVLSFPFLPRLTLITLIIITKCEID